VEPEQEPQLYAARAPTSPAPNQMFNIGELSKMSKTVTFTIQFHNNLNQDKSEEKIARTHTLG
jgi:hypothetical protein